ncbi:helix-turn-helix transcriptional regulator [Kribbella sp. NPDC023855]|uniref:helix-turn-helix domain-containing protein n=1 Tax=Kribbella sp. NPDC023855 TaxID=3154698 RepID=UPI0033D9CBA8
MTGVEIWDHINATLDAIKWPAVVALAGWFLRRELAGLVRRLWKIEAGGARVEFDAKQETLMLGAEISESGQRVIDSAIGGAIRVTSYEGGLVDGAVTVDEAELDGGRPAIGSAPRPASGEEAPASGEQRPDLGKLRDDLGSLIEASFQAGFIAAIDAESAKGIPSPSVHWVGAEPRITGWTFETGNSAFRERLGNRMRRARENAGITRGDAGWTIRASESKISRMELGRTPFRERDVEDLLTLYGVTEDSERAELLQLARVASAFGR